jgi:hypothetical protein
MTHILTQTPESSYPWGSDKLSVYLKQVEQNTFAASVNLGPRFAALVSIHDFWVEVCETLAVTKDEDLLAMWFLQQANSAWIAALRIGLGGQSVDARPLLRSALEYAAYALHFTRDAALRDVWFDRHKDDASREKAANGFSTRKVSRTFKAESPALAAAYSRLYDAVVDMGGHPNERALSSRLNIEREPGVVLSWVTQITDDPRDFLTLVHIASQIALMVLEVFQHVFEPRFRLSLLDLKLEKLRVSTAAV